MRLNTRTLVFIWVLNGVLLSTVVSLGYGQGVSRVYQISGRVVDVSGHPVEGAEVTVSPFYDLSSKVFDLLEESTVTDANGRFSISKRFGAGTRLYLYTALSATGEYLISPPFSFSNARDRRFLGKLFVTREKSEIELGDFTVQFHFGDVRLKVTSNGRSLTEADWKNLWIVLSNDRRVVLYQQSIGPVIKQPEIDIPASIAFYALPEGKYRIEFRSFDDDNVPPTVGRRSLGATRLFEIKRNETLNLTVDLLLK